MNKKEFVNILSIQVRDAASEDVLELLKSPPGRHPKENLVRLSQWYNGLDKGDRDALADVVRMVSDHSLFGFMSILDGVRSIESESVESCLKLTYEKEGEVVTLNDDTGPMLHELI
jgi:hypothetical protein